MVTNRKSKERTDRVPLRQHARTMRHIPTDAEKKFWRMVRDRRMGGYKFKRQHPIGRYIADFVCIEGKLVVELDGGQHAERREYDTERDAFFESQGFRVVPFWNAEFLKNQDAVARQLLTQLDGGKTPSPQPSPPLRGGEGEVTSDGLQAGFCPRAGARWMAIPLGRLSSGASRDRPGRQPGRARWTTAKRCAK